MALRMFHSYGLNLLQGVASVIAVGQTWSSQHHVVTWRGRSSIFLEPVVNQLFEVGLSRDVLGVDID